MTSNYQKIKSIILRLNQVDSIKNKIIIVGGTVPYLVSKKESNREHSDIDVNFAPYELTGNGMIQRNFLTRQSSGIDALATVTMKIMDVNMVFAETCVDGTAIHTYSLEMVKIMKEKSKKKKDAADIRVIDDFGYDEDIYSALKEQLKDMKFKIEPGNKFLKLFFR